MFSIRSAPRGTKSALGLHFTPPPHNCFLVADNIVLALTPSIVKNFNADSFTHQLIFFFRHRRIVQGNVNYVHHYWEQTYGEKPQKSAFTRFEGETARLYQVLEDQLKRQEQRGSSFIALDRPTIADFAFWPWVRIASFGNIDLSPYPAVQKWCATIENDAKSQAAVGKLPTK